MAKQTIKGRLDVICGSMFSGKSEELIRRIRRAELANQKVCVFKHKVDDRVSIDSVDSHSGYRCKAVAIENPVDMELFVTEDCKVIAIDEIQFFGEEIASIIIDFVDSGKQVMVAGLDLDFRGIPFGCMPTLMAIADSITKLSAVCMVCGQEAHFTQDLLTVVQQNSTILLFSSVRKNRTKHVVVIATQ